ncbi:MAG: Tad domain-containing protein [Tabrizicola sp.]|nr:Tad domain-containing protein [Tabrizicola sp.]
MLKKPASRTVAAAFHRSFSKFLHDETGAMAIFGLFIFFLMLAFGGIAVDVMRSETRRVTLIQTTDRISLAAASLRQQRPVQDVVEDWWAASGIYSGHAARFDAPVLQVDQTTSLRRVTVSSKVRSYNHFMHLLDVDYLDAPTVSQAAQGVSHIEVMMVLDITGSMNSPASSGTTTKIQDLRTYAQEFVDIVKANDSKDGVSIGIVPYAAQVNIPANLRQQFTVSRLSSWNGIANQGVPNINCIEMPTTTYSATALSRSATMPMAAVADTTSSTSNTTNFVAPTSGTPSATGRICTTTPDSGSTSYNDELVNHVFLPTKNGDAVKERIARLTANGNTSIALGMRWGTALIDESARDIYTAIGDSTVQGRPADNPATSDDIHARKIIILMTDGEHVSNTHVYDTYKTGLSPIWRGADGNFAIRFTAGGPALTGGTRPACAGTRTYFAPHLKPNSDTTCNSSTSAGRVAWLTTPTWTGSGTAVQLDWSEVWRYLRVSWVARQLYMRSNVTGTSNYDTIMNQFRGTYLSVSNMNSLLQANCTAAKNAGIEIYGIAFAAPAGGQAQIQGCSTNVENYYFDAKNGEDLRSAFNTIATYISDLRLTQ